MNRTGISQIPKDEDNEELRYSVRSILRYIPWIRKIFIVMPNEKVKFFKPIEEIKKKIVYIKDKDLLGFDSANNQAFLFNYYKLDKFGVSRNFIYMDDDYFIGRPLKKTDFFYYDEKDKKVKPFLISYIIHDFNKKELINEYNFLFKNKDKLHPHSYDGWKLSIDSTSKFFIDNYNVTPLIYTEFTHNAMPMNILDLKEIFKEVQKYEYINGTLYSIQRYILRLFCQYFYSLYFLNIKHRKVHPIPYEYIQFEKIKNKKLNAPLFVINTGFSKKLKKEEIENGLAKIQKRFPHPTKYEIISENELRNCEYIEEKDVEKDNEDDFEDVKNY